MPAASDQQQLARTAGEGGRQHFRRHASEPVAGKEIQMPAPSVRGIARVRIRSLAQQQKTTAANVPACPTAAPVDRRPGFARSAAPTPTSVATYQLDRSTGARSFTGGAMTTKSSHDGATLENHCLPAAAHPAEWVLGRSILQGTTRTSRIPPAHIGERQRSRARDFSIL